MRDQSAGPVLVRRRSDSNGASDIQDVSDLELDSTNEDMPDEPVYQPFKSDRMNALGISVGRPSIASSSANSTFEGGIAPANSIWLEAGTWCTKVTKRKRKQVKLWLDASSARVCWHSSSPSKSFFVDDITECRIGAASRNARDDVKIPPEEESLWITIVYTVPERSKGRTIKTMHILFKEEIMVHRWNSVLTAVTKGRIEIMNALTAVPEKAEKSMAMAWQSVMTRKDRSTDADGRLSLDDARWLCRMLEVNCTDSAVKTHFKAISHSEDGSLDYEGYKRFVQSFRERKDITHIFRNISFGTDLDMDLPTFLEFLRKEQKVDVNRDRAYWESVFDKYSRPAQNRPTLPDAEHIPVPRVLTTASFQSFMTSSHTLPLAVSKGNPIWTDRSMNISFPAPTTPICWAAR
jgi:phosphatidylinositol phospholipase C delta